MKGRPEDGLPLPMSLMFFVRHVDAVDVDPAVKDGTPAAKSRAYAVATEQIYSTNTLTQAPRLLRPTGAYNAELVAQLSHDMKVKMRNYAAPKRKS